MSIKQSQVEKHRLAHLTGVLDQGNPLAKILDLAADAIISTDVRQSILFFNRGAEKAFGYSAEEVGGKPLQALLPGAFVELRKEHMVSWVRSEGTRRRELVARHKDGGEFPVHVKLSKLKVEGHTVFSFLIQHVTPKALVEERLRAALREKEVLLEEVHHRVKNNLQVITSLLGLQARSIHDPATRAKFEESRDRIQAMAVLHEILDESSSLAEIDLADYIRRLAEHLVRSYGAAARVRMQFCLDSLSCHRDVALPCGLILNELLSNALKYAFPNGDSGEVRIELRRHSNGTINLLIADDGIGLSRDWPSDGFSTLGLRLVRTLARQIEALVQIDRKQGTAFSIAFRDGLPRNIRQSRGGLGG